MVSILICIENSLSDVSQMSWGKFKDIRQFGEGNVPVVEGIVV